MNAARTIQLFSVAVIANGLAALLWLSPSTAEASSCGFWDTCIFENNSCLDAEAICDANAPPGCVDGGGVCIFGWDAQWYCPPWMADYAPNLEYISCWFVPE